MIIVIMGAAGSGKSTVGRQLSEQLQWVFLDGDAVHPPENIAKMARGTLLNDEDRRPWLQALRTSIAEWTAGHTDAVLACSLLKQTYRDTVLGGYEPQVKLVYLQASRALLQVRLTTRTGHFAGVALLDSQLALLEEPADALVADASQSPDHLVQTIRNTWHL
jgi:carbohydrate kinase (thermoresistant glucokinase family)